MGFYWSVKKQLIVPTNQSKFPKKTDKNIELELSKII